LIRHGYFVASALSLVDHLKVGIVGKPWRNGLMERLFRTPKEQLLPYFSGLTFGNPVEKGDFDAMADRLKLAPTRAKITGNNWLRQRHDCSGNIVG